MARRQGVGRLGLRMRIEMKKRVKLKGRLKIYMQISMYLGLLLLLVDIGIYFLDMRTKKRCEFAVDVIWRLQAVC